jgi:hypothetical protein
MARLMEVAGIMLLLLPVRALALREEAKVPFASPCLIPSWVLQGHDDLTQHEAIKEYQVMPHAAGLLEGE